MPHQPDLTGHTAIVTGAAGGMGRAHARRLAQLGAYVTVTDRVRSSALEKIATDTGGTAVAADLSSPEDCRRLVREAETQAGSADILVANHAYMSMSPFLEADPADWWSVIDTNLGGTFHLAQAVLPQMRRRGAGRIVIVSSEWGVSGWPEATGYSASKAGLIALTKSLGRELAPEGIIVNAVAPGVTDTPQLEVDARAAHVDLDQIRAVYAAGIPLGRIASPEEISAVVALLVDFERSGMVGQTIQANGGSTRGRV